MYINVVVSASSCPQGLCLGIKRIGLDLRGAVTQAAVRHHTLHCPIVISGYQRSNVEDVYTVVYTHQLGTSVMVMASSRGK